MTRRLLVDADLTFTVRPAGDAKGWGGTIRGTGDSLEVSVDELPSGGGRPPLIALRRAAAGLGRLGLRVTLTGPDGPLLTVGSVRARLLDRVLTRSSHVHVHSWRRVIGGARRGLGPRVRYQQPPSTPWPPAPTVGRRLRRHVRTPHDPWGRGMPRLAFVVGPAPRDGVLRRVHYLAPGGTTIGSAADADLRVVEVPSLCARVVRDETDEYFLEPVGGGHGAAGVVSVNGVTGPRLLLRTGSRVQVGPWTMVYFRAEHADHGRPFGGREGAEFSEQRRQPERRP